MRLLYYLLIWLVILSMYSSWLACHSFVLSHSYFFYYLLDYGSRFVFDGLTTFCLIALLACGSLALAYCRKYPLSFSDKYSLFSLMILFICIMAFLFVSDSLVVTLICWEFVGLSSFILVVFYGSLKSLRAGVITFFSSRFGDVSLFLLFALVSYYDVLSLQDSLFCFVLLCFIAFTKGATCPFSSWLLEAMRAPTPVSALVHSSTLVASGVWFMLRYEEFMTTVEYQDLAFLVLCIITILVSALYALETKDLKELVAASTCNNIAWCGAFYACGFNDIALAQLVVHAICKCILFIVLGDVMTGSGGAQHRSGAYIGRVSGFWKTSSFVSLVFCLSGFPYTGFFLQKHAFSGGLTFSSSYLLVSLYFVCVLFTFAYSIRLLLELCKRTVGRNIGYVRSFYLVFSFMILGTVWSLLFFGAFAEIWSDSLINSCYYLIVLCLGVVFGSYWYNHSSPGVDTGEFFITGWFGSLCGSDYIVNMFYSWYNKVSNSCFVVFYRWEHYLLGVLSRKGYTCSVNDVSWLSFNFLVLGLLFCCLSGFFYV